MKLCVLFIALVLQSSLFSEAPLIVMLLGSGSAGKTSIGKAFQEMQNDWLVIDEDDVYIQMWLDTFAERFPDSFSVISEVIAPYNRYNAIKKSEIFFQEGADPLKCQEALEAISLIQLGFMDLDEEAFKDYFQQSFEEALLDRIRSGLKTHQNLMIDSWFFSPTRMQEIFPEAEVVKVLVFSSLPSSFDKFQKRRREALLTKNLYSSRWYNDFLPSYVDLYRVTEDPTNALIMCETEEIERIFQVARDELGEIESKPRNVQKELTQEELDLLKEEFLPSDLRQEAIFIVPKESYDIILNTTKTQPEEVTRELRNRLCRSVIETRSFD